PATERTKVANRMVTRVMRKRETDVTFRIVRMNRIAEMLKSESAIKAPPKKPCVMRERLMQPSRVSIRTRQRLRIGLRPDKRDSTVAAASATKPRTTIGRYSCNSGANASTGRKNKSATNAMYKKKFIAGYRPGS